MTMDDRLGYLILGCIIGFMLGYVTRSLRSIKETVEEVDEIVKRERDERGLIHKNVLSDIALVVVVLLTVFAAFSSQKATNEIKTTQERVERITVCNQEYLTQTIDALNERTTYSRAQASANVELQRSQAAFLTLVLREDPPIDKAEFSVALNEYFAAVTNFVDLTGKTDEKRDTNPYPDNGELMSCVTGTS